MSSSHHPASGVTIRRSVDDQSPHDTVIAWLLHALGEQGHTTVGNPGQEKNLPVFGQYPDVVVVELQESAAHSVERLYEVETVESVNDTEAVHQWKPYSDLGVPFTLVVPAECLLAARDLLEDYEIAADLMPYVIDGVSGQVQFEWPQG